MVFFLNFIWSHAHSLLFYATAAHRIFIMWLKVKWECFCVFVCVCMMLCAKKVNSFCTFSFRLVIRSSDKSPYHFVLDCVFITSLYFLPNKWFCIEWKPHWIPKAHTHTHKGSIHMCDKVSCVLAKFAITKHLYMYKWYSMSTVGL